MENLTGLRDGSLGFAIVQSDGMAQAVAGQGSFADAGPDTGLRSVMSLYPEALTLVVRADAGVARVEDLAGKRVVLGADGSGTRVLADAVIAALGWTQRVSPPRRTSSRRGSGRRSATARSTLSSMPSGIRRG